MNRADLSSEPGGTAKYGQFDSGGMLSPLLRTNDFSRINPSAARNQRSCNDFSQMPGPRINVRSQPSWSIFPIIAKYGKCVQRAAARSPPAHVVRGPECPAACTSCRQSFWPS